MALSEVEEQEAEGQKKSSRMCREENILWLLRKALLRTGRPLTIACHMKKNLTS
jgi:hypothetical protein